MNTMLAVLLVCASLFVVVMLFVIRAVDHQSRTEHRIRSLREKSADRTTAIGVRSPFVAVRAFGEMLAKSRIMPARTLIELERSLTAAGYRSRGAMGLFIGSKVLLLIFLPVVAYFALRSQHLKPLYNFGALVAVALVGLLLPDFVIGRLRTRYLAAVEAGLADALDMMVICAEAGLALEATIERVAIEIEAAHREVSSELWLTGGEMRITSDRRIALVNLGVRTTLPSLKRLGGTLIQTMQYGTPLGQALRTLSVELRQETLTRFEERAARLPVLLTMPMILFILPCVFIVVGGPAALQISRQLLH